MTGDHGFHRPQSLAALPDAGLEVSIEAKPSERKTLASFLDIPEVGQLRAQVLIQRWRGHGVRVTGQLDAQVVQTCVATLAPVPAVISAPIDRKFLPETMLDHEADPHEILLDPDGEDPPDPLRQMLDLGELAAEELALSLDPYPRSGGGAIQSGEAEPVSKENPFAALQGLLKR